MKPSSAPLLALSKVTKSFPGTKALDGVSLTVHAGEVVALMGENGAGKSTLMKILSGAWPHGSFEGEIRVADDSGALVPREFHDTRGAHDAGIAMIHQELSVFPELTVAEHLTLDKLPRWIDWESIYVETQKFLDTLGFGLESRARVGGLSVGNQQLVEIARALYRKARILIFDEPTSALTEQEAQRLFTIVDQLRAEGRGIIYITHRMDEVFRLSDRIVVLRDGTYVTEAPCQRAGGPAVRAELEPKLISWMVGRSIGNIYPEKNRAIGAEVLRVEDLRVASPEGKTLVDGLSFGVRAGEVVGLGGLLGAGRSETFDAIFGILHGNGPKGAGYSVSGKIRINGREREPGVPEESLDDFLGYVSEDRKGSGLVLNHSIRDNVSLPALSAGRGGLTGSRGLLAFVSDSEEVEAAEQWRRKLRIKLADIEQPVGELSGGNQQKVVLAKWLLTGPKVLFLDEPTRGVDVGAKAEIYDWIRDLAASGIGIVLASSEMPELIGLCHRVLVLREGHVSAELGETDISQEKIMRAASL